MIARAAKSNRSVFGAHHQTVDGPFEKRDDSTGLQYRSLGKAKPLSQRTRLPEFPITV
jgi:hypothetical protein